MRAVTTQRAWRLGTVLALVLGADTLAGQGEATVSTQGFYMGSTGQQSIDTSGLALHFQQFIPNVGLLDSKLENYEGDGLWQHGDNYLELRGLVWKDTRWTFRYGNCRVPTTLTAFPFSNFLNPDLTLRGGCAEARRGHFSYSVFDGTEVLQSGPRIPFWQSTPQNIKGASAKYRLGNLELAVRYLRLNNAVDQLEQNSFLFPANRQFSQADVFTGKVSYNYKGHLRLYGEEDFSHANFLEQDTPTGKHPWSSLFGAAFDSQRISVRANYSDQGILTLPVVGYFAGDRRGPFADFRLRPSHWLELFGSAARQSNNLEQESTVPTLRSASAMAGASVHLPFRMSASVQLSDLDLRVNTVATSQETSSGNLMTTATLTRPFAHHDLNLTLREIKVNSNGKLDVQTSREIADTTHWRNFVVGGAVRFDTDLSDSRRNTIYGRGNAQVHLKKLTAYTYFEVGQDLVNQSVFTTSAIRTSVLGLSSQMPGGWELQAEAFRSNLTTILNPTNVFLLSTQGSAFPGALTGLNQWSVYLRMTRQFTWGRDRGQEDLDRYTVEQIPIVGVVEGIVRTQTRGGVLPANGITVSVDDARFSVTDDSGHYRLANVPEGYHAIRLALDKLPTDLEPGPIPPDQYTIVRGGQTTRQDFLVYPLTGFCGSVEGPSGVALDNVVLRLMPSEKYTTPDPDGGFCFYNIREDDYDVELDSSTLPPQVRPLSPVTAPFALKLTPDAQPTPIVFRLGAIVEERPIRKVLEDRVIRIAPEQPTPAPTARASVMQPPAPKAEPVTVDPGPVNPPAATPEPVQPARAAPPPGNRSAAAVAPSVPKPVKPSLLRPAELQREKAKAAELHNTRGRKLTEQKKYTQAIAELTLAIQLKPDYALAYNARGFAYLKARRAREALRDLDRAISLRPNYLNAYQNRANARKLLGDLDGAAQDAAKARELSSSGK